MALSSKGSRGLPLLIICSFYRKKVSMGFLVSLGHHYLMLNNCGNTRDERPVLGLTSSQVFYTSFCMTCFVSMVMGLGPRFGVFSY
jgi:hypothetical protein